MNNNAQSSAPVAPDRLLEIAFSFAASKAMLSAIELGLFTHLAKGPQTFEQLRAALKLHSRSARDFFDTLVALKVIDREDTPAGSRYRNTAESDAFLDRNKEAYIGGMLEMANKRLYKFWGNLTEGLQTGKPQNEIKNEEDLFTALYSDPERLRGFLGAMTGLSAMTARAIAQKFEWRAHKTMIDIGCAQGCLPVQVALAHPHITGGGFDLKQVKPIFNDYVKSKGISDRLRFYEGDMFKDSLPSADVHVMGHILHDWGTQAKLDLCRKSYESLPQGGALIVYDAMIDDARRENLGGLLMSLNMLIETQDGYDYTGADCKQWFKDTGFRDVRQVHLHGADSMVVGIK